MDRRQYLSTGTIVDFRVNLVDNPRFHMHLVQKESEPSDRPIIHSTEWQRLTFFRAYTAPVFKNQLVNLPTVALNAFIWFHILNTFMKTLPHSFLHFFMASYAPEEHIFLTKMVPACYGFKYLLVMSSFLEMILSMDTVILMLHYTLDGIARKNPWNRCSNASYYDPFYEVVIHCYSVEDFSEKIINKTIEYDKFAYVTQDKEIFHLPQIEYYRRIGLYSDIFNTIRNCIYWVLLWLLMTFFHTQVERKIFWQILNGIHWALNTSDIITFIYLLGVNKQMEVPEDPEAEPLPEISIFSSKFWAADVNFVAESISTPALVHILSARSTQEINPGLNAAKMVISNTMIYLFRVLLGFKIKLYIESNLNTETFLMEFYERDVFFYWTVFYSDFYLGNLCTLFFFSCNGMSDFMVMMVIYHCLIETIKYEWKKFKIYIIKAALFVISVIMFFFTSIWTRALLFIYGKSISTLTESVFLYVLYPLGRFVDDYTFHYGSPPTRLRIISLRLVPVYYVFKCYFMVQAIWVVMSNPDNEDLVPHYVWSWSLMVIPLIIGGLITVYQYLVRKRMTWQYIFRPHPKWGPRDFSERQLRKQYNSKYYISSEVPKLLSRYLMSKRESEVYKVDVRYDVQRRSTVSKAVGFGAFLNVDKKKI